MFILIFFALLQTTANCSDKDRIDQISTELVELQALKVRCIKKRLPIAHINQSIADLLNKLPADKKEYYQLVLPRIRYKDLRSFGPSTENTTTKTTPKATTNVSAQPPINVDTDIKIHGMIATFLAFENTVMNNQKN